MANHSPTKFAHYKSQLIDEFLQLDISKMELLLFIAQNVELMDELEQLPTKNDNRIRAFLQKCQGKLLEHGDKN